MSKANRRLARLAVVTGCVGRAAVFAENCGGSVNMDPRYCLYQSLCDPSNIRAGDTVPLRIRMTNKANYESEAGETVYVPGTFKAGSYIQIVFACEDGIDCQQISSEQLVEMIR